MNNTPLEHHAEHFLAVARRHPECRGGRILDTTGESAILELHLHVELPLHMKVDGVSPNGVQQHETTTVVLDADYPWSTPTFYLRSDFPRDLPHLQPDPSGTPPRPCLVDADQREYFFQFGLIEAGIFHLIQQLVLWLQHAAEGNLIDSEQGWEPTLRHNLASLLMIDAETCRAMVDRRGGFRVFRSWFYRLGPDDASLTNGASVMLHVGTEIIPLKRGNMNLLGFRRNVNGTSGNTVGCLVWPDKQPDGTPFISDRYMPETVTTLADLRQRADELGCGRGFRDFLDLLEQCFQGYFLEQPIPISVILCARRPCHLIGSSSQIELLPYVVDISLKQNRSSVFAAAENEPASPTMQLDVVNPALITRVTGTSAAGPITLLGCGSVGSKLGMHLARSGVEIHVISDRGVLLPHNLI
ncbi:hypothetical protein BZY95_16810 [Billgrantia desiderata SP1]|uniref:hypothetical protein n=1 Tax=Billgrantia desiderata TaxID=52021 RepID=UPI000B64D50A|nr:hypothetical protein [Halomonas desiderata]OUE39299.1 hypothetical protein BZY95_16810 [Halomonas desiderata SP1]